MARKEIQILRPLLAGLKVVANSEKNLQARFVAGCALQCRPYYTLNTAERAEKVKTGMFALLWPDINFQINQSFKMHQAPYYISTRNL